jgi:hypothetical protein
MILRVEDGVSGKRHLFQYHFVHQTSVTDSTAIEMCCHCSDRLRTGCITKWPVKTDAYFSRALARTHTYMHIFSLYLTDNTARLCYKDQPVNL